jgi:hypothetical protein
VVDSNRHEIQRMDGEIEADLQFLGSLYKQDSKKLKKALGERLKPNPDL